MQQGFKDSFSISIPHLPLAPKTMSKILLKNYADKIFCWTCCLFIEDWGGEGNKISYEIFAGVCHLVKDAFLGKIGESVKYILS